MAKEQTSVRVEPQDRDAIQILVNQGLFKDTSAFIQVAIKEKLSANRVAADVSPETMKGIRRLIEIGAYNNVDSFVREAVQRLLFIAKDHEAVRETLFQVVLEDPKFKDLMLRFIREVVVEGFRPPPKT